MMNIEISNPPLSADQLADKRRIHSEQLKAYVMRGRYYKYGFYTIGMVGVVIAGLLWMYGFIRDGELVGVCAVMAALVVIVMSMGRDIIVDSSVIVLIIVAQILLYALMVLAGLTGMLSIEVEIDTVAGSPDTFQWKAQPWGGAWSSPVTGVACSTAATLLDSNVFIDFDAVDGHAVGDKW